MKGISVIVCCFNSEPRLGATIAHLVSQKTNKNLAWELIIIDNASTDNTAAIAQQLWNTHSSNAEFRIIEEQKKGLSNARLCGVKNAKYEYLIFCDDDNWLTDSYLQTVFNTFETHPNVGICGGLGQEITEITPDGNWFETYKIGYAVGKQATTNGLANHVKQLFGAGMGLRKNIVDFVVLQNYKFLLNDRQGNSLSAGNDAEICQIALLFGYDLYYSDQLTFKHFIPKNRLSYNYMYRLFEGFGLAAPVLSQYYAQTSGSILDQYWGFQVLKRIFVTITRLFSEKTLRDYQFTHLKALWQAWPQYRRQRQQIKNLKQQWLEKR
jgi:glycosyltransferase involved in cell wall biosynthesis